MNDLQGIEAHAHSVVKCRTRNCPDEVGSLGTAVKPEIGNFGTEIGNRKSEFRTGYGVNLLSALDLRGSK